MFKALSFVEAYEMLAVCEKAVDALRPILGECFMEVIHDSLQHYARTQALLESDYDRDCVVLLALAFARGGYNTLLPEFDVTLPLMVSNHSGDVA